MKNNAVRESSLKVRERWAVNYDADEREAIFARAKRETGRNPFLDAFIAGDKNAVAIMDTWRFTITPEEAYTQHMMGRYGINSYSLTSGEAHRAALNAGWRPARGVVQVMAKIPKIVETDYSEGGEIVQGQVGKLDSIVERVEIDTAFMGSVTTPDDYSVMRHDIERGMYESAPSYTKRRLRMLKAGGNNSKDEQDTLNLLDLCYTVVRANNNYKHIEDSAFELYASLLGGDYGRKTDETVLDYVTRVWENRGKKLSRDGKKDAIYGKRALQFDDDVDDDGEDSYYGYKGNGGTLTLDMAMMQTATTLPIDEPHVAKYLILANGKKLYQIPHHLKVAKLEALRDAERHYIRRTQTPFLFDEMQQAEIGRLVEALQGKKNPHDAAIVVMLLSGDTRKEIEEYLGWTAKTLDNAIQRIAKVAEKNRTPEEKALLASVLERFERAFARKIQENAADGWGEEPDLTYYEANVPDNRLRIVIKQKRLVRQAIDEGWELLYAEREYLEDALSA